MRVAEYIGAVIALVIGGVVLVALSAVMPVRAVRKAWARRG